MTLITDLAGAISSVGERFGQSVVGLGARWGLGSGIVLEDGLVLTNAHNIEGEISRVGFVDGRVDEGPASFDMHRDVALVEVDTRDLALVAWSPDDVLVSVGTPVISLSNPGGRGLHVTLGFISATDRSFRGPRGRKIRGGFEHTAPAVPGSSGGPVVDLDGNLLGVNTRRMEHGFYIAQTANNELRTVVDALRSGERPQPRRLGVGVAPSAVTRRLRASMGLDEVDGLLVRHVEEGSPAQGAGLTEGDVITEAGGSPIGDLDDLHEALSHASETLELRVVRVNDSLSVVVEF